MELHTIYEDKKTKIEILKVFHELLLDSQPKWINLGYVAKDFLYGQVLKSLDFKKRGWDCKERLSAANCPIIETMRPVALVAPFDVFNRALGIIAYGMARLHFNKEEIKEEISNLCKDEDYEIVCDFFPVRLFKIDGFLAYYYNGTLLILLFSLKEDDTNEEYR